MRCISHHNSPPSKEQARPLSACSRLRLTNYAYSLETERADLGLRDRRGFRSAPSLRLVAFLFIALFLLLAYGATLALIGGGCTSRVRPGRGLGLRGVAGLRSSSEADFEPAGFSGRRVVPERCYGWRGGCVIEI